MRRVVFRSIPNAHMTVKIVYGIFLYTIFFAYLLFIVTINKDKFYFNFIHNSTISTFNDDFTTKSLLSHIVQKG